MSMLRGLDRRGALADVVHVHSARTSDDVVFGEQLRALAERHAGYRLHLQLTGECGRLSPADLDRLCPDWRERETFVSGPGAMLDALPAHWEEHADAARLHMERFQPVIGGDAAGGAGGRSPSRRAAHGARRTARRSSSPARRPGRAAFGCRMGICRTCVGRLCSGRVRDLRTGKVSGRRGRDRPHLHQRARGARRDRPLNDEEPMATMIESPLAHLTDEEIDELAREFDAIHDEVFAELGERDRRYITRMIAIHRGLAVLGRVLLFGARYKPAWIAGTATLSVAKILENMEIGHNVMHGQWDWMHDPYIHSSNWDWDSASTPEAWKHSHNYIHHTYTNIRGKDKDLGYKIMRIDPHQPWDPIYLLQPAYNVR